MIDFNTFDEIQHKPLRTFNRAVFFCNIWEDHGKAFAEDYALQFSMEERLEIAKTISAVKKFGAKRVRELVTQGVVFPENMTEEEAAAQKGDK